LEDMDKAIEIMKAAMKKEQTMNEKSKESMDGQINAEAQTTTFDKEVKSTDQGNSNDLAEDITLCSKDQPEDLEGLADDIEETDAFETKQAKSGKSLFKNSKSKELAVKDQKIEELNDKIMRSMAEFDNFRKRSEKEKAQMFDIGVKSIVEKMLPIVDNFERGLGTISEKEKENAFAQGIELIHKQLVAALEEVGVKPIDAVGKEFDPNLHNAVMHGEDESLGENIVSDEFQKGYMYRDYVVRHSMVKVVN